MSDWACGSAKSLRRGEGECAQGVSADTNHRTDRHVFAATRDDLSLLLHVGRGANRRLQKRNAIPLDSISGDHGRILESALRQSDLSFNLLEFHADRHGGGCSAGIGIAYHGLFAVESAVSGKECSAISLYRDYAHTLSGYAAAQLPAGTQNGSVQYMVGSDSAGCICAVGRVSDVAVCERDSLGDDRGDAYGDLLQSARDRSTGCAECEGGASDSSDSGVCGELEYGRAAVDSDRGSVAISAVHPVECAGRIGAGYPVPGCSAVYDSGGASVLHL